jgi:hypothetical protein
VEIPKLTESVEALDAAGHSKFLKYGNILHVCTVAEFSGPVVLNGSKQNDARHFVGSPTTYSLFVV